MPMETRGSYVWRDFATENLPVAGTEHKPEKAEIRAWAAEIEAKTIPVEALSATSITPTTIGIGSRSFDTQTGKAFDVGRFLLITSDANPSNWMVGQVAAYSETVLTVDVTAIGGSGIYSDWTINISGPQGGIGPPGDVSSNSTFALTSDLTPAQITSDQNDYNPAGASTSTVLRLSADADRIVTGLAGGVDGRVAIVGNVDDPLLTLANQNDGGASSLAANRFGTPDDIHIGLGDFFPFLYDGVANLWRLIGGRGDTHGPEYFVDGFSLLRWVKDAWGRLCHGTFEDGSFGVGTIRYFSDEEEIYIDGQRVLWSLSDKDNRAVLVCFEDGSVGVKGIRQLSGSDEIYVAGRRVLWSVADRDDRLALAALEDGTVYIPRLETDAGTTFSYIDPATLTGPGNVFGAHYIAAAIARFLADGEGQTRAYVQRLDLDPPSTTAMFEAAGPIEYFPDDGESLSVGGGSTTVVHADPVYPYYAFMFNTGARGANVSSADPNAIIDVVPIKEIGETIGGTTTGETPGSAMLQYLHKAAVDNDENLRTLLYCTHGRSGAKIVDILPGTTSYINGLIYLDRALTIALQGYNRSLVVRAMGFDLGANDREAPTVRATFKTNVIVFFDAVQVDWAHALPAGQSALKFFICQTGASTSGAANYPAMVQYELARDRSDVAICCPKYMLPMVDIVHLTALGYAIVGEYRARAWRSEFILGVPWKACQPISGVKTGTQVDILFHVPVAPLKWASPPQGSATNRGFSAFQSDGVTPVTTSSVTLLGDGVTVRIVLATNPGTVIIRYAGTGPGASGYAGAWGELCDSSTEISINDPTFTLVNRAVIFEETYS